MQFSKQCSPKNSCAEGKNSPNLVTLSYYLTAAAKQERDFSRIFTNFWQHDEMNGFNAQSTKT
jgi:hypothetical protein